MFDRLSLCRSARRAIACAALATASGACAHDFWIQPNAYRLEPETDMPMTLQVGHGPLRQRSPIPRNRIVRFDAIGANGAATDLRDSLHPGAASDDATLRFADTGTYMLVLETDSRAQSHLPALRFNDYLVAEGLAPAIELRERTHRTGVDGSERYRRVAKAIVHVGAPNAASETDVTIPLGSPLEIVPLSSPYSDSPSTALPIAVLYEGNALQGALVKLTDLAHDETPTETHVTDASGRATFARPTRGAWLLNVIWTKPLSNADDVEFETTFSSLSFGFPPNAR